MKHFYRGLIMAGCLFSAGVSAKALSIGYILPPSTICQDDKLSQQEDWQNALKLVVFLPEQSDYEGMMKYAFDQYFLSQNAFSTYDHNRNIKVIYMTGSPPSNLLSWPYLNGCEVTSKTTDIQKLSQLVGTQLPKRNQSDATVLLLDKRDIVRWRSDDYRAQGEQLKPLEKTIKQLLGESDPIMTDTPEQNRPNVGDPAPDFTLKNGQRLSDLKGKTVLITFYPAAFSGIIPTVDPISNEAAKTALETKQRSMMMCSMQLTSLDETPSAAHTTDPTIIKLAISSATPKLLNGWKNLLKTHDIDYISDIDYSISQRYGSYDAAQGYNKRVVFIIDKKGEIAFVDDDYTIDDAEKIKQVLRTIDKQP